MAIHGARPGLDVSWRGGEPGGPRTVNAAGSAVALWSLLYLTPHVMWACGATLGLAALHPSVASLPQWRAINWIASAILGAATLLGIALRRAPHRSAARQTVLALTWAGSCVATAHGLMGIAMRIRTLASWPPDAPPPGAWLHWDLLAFEPWFLIEGVLLAFAGGAILQTPRQRALWIVACAAGTALAIVLALLHVKIGWQRAA